MNCEKKQKCVVATYQRRSIFTVPKHIDIENVYEWYVENNILFIRLTKEEMKFIKIEPSIDAEDEMVDTTGYPVEEDIDDADNYGVEDEDEKLIENEDSYHPKMCSYCGWCPEFVDSHVTWAQRKECQEN